jgi:hypothetical protein
MHRLSRRWHTRLHNPEQTRQKDSAMEHPSPAHRSDDEETTDGSAGGPLSSHTEGEHDFVLAARDAGSAAGSMLPNSSGPSAAVELEPGWSARRALTHISSDELLAVMMRPSFRPVKDLDLVPVTLCPHCLDGGLRTAGSVRTRRGREQVRACDTCAEVEIGDGPAPRWA